MTTFELSAREFNLPGAPNAINTLDDWATFEKAAQASSYETDHAALTGMSALRVESLEPSLRAVVAKAKNFTLWNMLKRQPTTSALQEYTVQTSLGGQLDGMSHAESGEIDFAKGEYERMVQRVKLFATGAEVTVFANAQTLIKSVDTLRAKENKNCLTRLAGGVERSIIHASEETSPDRPNGLIQQIGAFRDGQQVRDLQGLNDANALAQVAFDAKADVRQMDVWGDITHIFTDALVQNDLDKSLMPQYRVHLEEHPKALEYGAPVSEIKTSYGNVAIAELFLANNANNSAPYFAKSKGKLPDKCPGQPVATAVPVANANKGKALGWNAEEAGDFWLVVTAVDSVGREGQPSVPVAVTVPVGGAIDVAGTVPLAGTTTHTALRYYRSRRNTPTVPALADFRFVSEFKAGTTYRDVNQEIPGSSHIFLLNMDPESIDWVQLRPATQYPLAVTNTLTMRWAAYLFGTLRLALPQHHFHAKNYLPKTAIWKPFK